MIPSNILKIDIFYFLNCFFIYSFFGWLFECVVIAFQEKSVENRGFVKGPLCTIYGAGALGTYYFLQPLADNTLALFLVGAFLATVFEMVVAKVMTYLFGYFWWDYNDRPFNYHGVICLESSLCWGAMAVATFMFFQPFIESIVDIYYDRFGKLVAMVILVGYCIDFSTSFYRAWGERAENKQETIPQNEMEEPEPELSR